tara:strand:- start:292 stop:546 length:255 start_codon:yes stop_codon:yes gene_type:complete
MNVLDFLSDVDRENYFKEYKENVDVYITAFNYVRDKLKDEDVEVVVKIVNEIIQNTNYNFAQMYPEYKSVADLGDNVYELSNYR